MARGDKDKYTSKQKRQAVHIEDGYEKRGVSKDKAEARAWATVNKMSGGDKEMRKASAKKAAATRRKRTG
jgi:hypothetical protein